MRKRRLDCYVKHQKLNQISFVFFQHKELSLYQLLPLLNGIKIKILTQIKMLKTNSWYLLAPKRIHSFLFNSISLLIYRYWKN